MKMLAFADKDPVINIPQTIIDEKIDLIVTLGDLDVFSLMPLKGITDVPKIGVYGNHCSGTYMDSLGIMNMNMATWQWSGLTFGGLQGCVRYKDNPQAIMYTQDEVNTMMADFPPVDIFICHCPPRGINDEDDELSHQGFDGLRAYIDRLPPRMLLHGHTYPPADELITQHGSTRIEYVFRSGIVEF